MTKTYKGQKGEIAKDVAEKMKKRAEIKKKNGERCVYCSCDNPLLLTIDHKIPLIRGGSNDDSNKQVCCHFDNQLKGGLTHKEYKKYLKCLCVLRELGKLHIQLTTPKLVFNPGYWPQFTLKKKEEKKEEKDEQETSQIPKNL